MNYDLGDYTSLYYYSALFQGNAALITLTAMFVIYKSQSLENKFSKIQKMLITYIRSTFELEMIYKDIWVLEKYDSNLFGYLDSRTIDRIKELMSSDQWGFRFVELKSIQKDIDNLWIEAQPSLIGIFIVLTLSIICLPLSRVIHTYPEVELMLFVAITFLEILSVRKLYIFTKDQLK